MDGMKLLVAYDGSASADAALASLERAGLPATVDAHVLTISDVWVPSSIEATVDEDPGDVEVVVEGRGIRALLEARGIARGARERLMRRFPGWTVHADAHADAAVPGILEKILAWRPDMVVVGTHGRSLIGRVLLGSVSHRLLSEAGCSVHIGRAPVRTIGPLQIVVGIDGSIDADEAVLALARRDLPAGTQIHLVSACSPIELQYAPTIVSVPVAELAGGEDGLRVLRSQLEEEAGKLAHRGLDVTTALRIGTPVPVLLDEARARAADMIVLGARGHRMLERLLLGSVSSAAAAHAPCSVEVIRPRRHGAARQSVA
jgi:nucleotide-binding universal stress UspA family protein